MTAPSWKFTTIMNIKFHRKNKRTLSHTLQNSRSYLVLLLTTTLFGLDRVWVTLSCMWPLRYPGRCSASSSHSRFDLVSQKSDSSLQDFTSPPTGGQGGHMHLHASNKMPPVDFLLMKLGISLRLLSIFTHSVWQSSWETGTARLCVCMWLCVYVCYFQNRENPLTLEELRERALIRVPVKSSLEESRDLHASEFWPA